MRLSPIYKSKQSCFVKMVFSAYGRKSKTIVLAGKDLGKNVSRRKQK